MMMFVPTTAVQQYDDIDRSNANTKNTMDSMSSLLLDALYLQERRLSLQDVQPQPPQHIQPAYYLPPSVNINMNPNVIPAISIGGRLYALAPYPDDQGIGRTAENFSVNHQPQYIQANRITEQDQDDLHSSNRGSTAAASAATASAAIALIESKHSKKATGLGPRKKAKDERGVKHRPAFHVPAKAFVSIQEPNMNDVLMGRGGRINKHIGNVQLRNLVGSRQDEYLSSSTAKLDKAYIAAEIVSSIRLQHHPPGRFLKQDPADNTWYEVGDEQAIKKVLQALRENAPLIRPVRINQKNVH